MDRIYFVSDVHLGAAARDQEHIKETRLLSLLDKIEHEKNQLFIVGDLFDFWFEYRHAIPRLHFRTLAKLSQLSRQHPVHYFCGNHDFWLNSFIQNEIGLVIHPDEWVTDIQGKRFYIRHGDGLLKNDYGYRFLKRVLRNRFNIFLYRLLHPDLGVPLALAFSNKSRKAGEKKAHTYMDVDYREFAFRKIDEGYDGVVLGHTHWAAVEAYHSGYYLNPGFFGNDFTYIVVENGVPSAYQWDGVNERNWALSFPPGNPA